MFFGPKELVGLVFLDCCDRSGVIKLKRLVVVHFSSRRGHNSTFVVAYLDLCSDLSRTAWPPLGLGRALFHLL